MNLSDLGAVASEDSLVPLPAVHAEKAPFPPGSLVWINKVDDEVHLVCDGQVVAVFLGDVFSAERKLFFKVRVLGHDVVMTFEESKLTFAPKCPVYFFEGDREAKKGEVLQCTSSLGQGNAIGIKPSYSIMLLPVVEQSILRIVKHDVPQERILFCREVDLDKPEEVIHLSSPVPSPAPSICSGIASVVSAPPGFTNATNNKSSFAEKVARGISNGFPQDFSRQRFLNLPAWLNKSFGHRLHGKIC